LFFACPREAQNAGRRGEVGAAAAAMVGSFRLPPIGGGCDGQA
jgi:hypothetical protein